MKKFGILMMFAAVMAFTSCSTLVGGSTTSAGSKAGSQASSALVGLYNSHKANGTIAITNPTDMTNILSLLSAYNELKSHKDDASYKSEFAKGMASVGGNVITTANATSVMNSMLSATGLSSNFSSANLSEKMQTVQAIITLVQLLK